MAELAPNAEQAVTTTASKAMRAKTRECISISVRTEPKELFCRITSQKKESSRPFDNIEAFPTCFYPLSTSIAFQ